jgi:hypothetical protein
MEDLVSGGRCVAFLGVRWEVRNRGRIKVVCKVKMEMARSFQLPIQSENLIYLWFKHTGQMGAMQGGEQREYLEQFLVNNANHVS